MSSKGLIVVAFGGNAFQTKGDKGTVEEYLRNAYIAADTIVKLVKDGYRVVVTHGNGPQVGLLAEWMLLGLKYKNTPPMSLDIAGAMTQGWLGYILQQAVLNKLREENLIPSIVKGAVTLVTQTLVRRDDPDFKDPSKYVGPWYERDEAEKLAKEYRWIFKPDPRGGYRRVVPSPDPIIQVEIDAIRTLVENGFIVIADGGGGVPVSEEDSKLKGVEGVIDKDLGAERMASALKADILLILTDVNYAYLNYGTSNPIPLKTITASDALRYYKEGHFKPGSMGPKILAGIRFVQNGGKLAIISNMKNALEALRGEIGTRITPG